MGDDDHKKMKMALGKLYGVGLGPGDPELLTIKAIKILRLVDVVFIPQSEHKADSPATHLVKHYVPDKRREKMIFPMTRNKKHLHNFWRQAAASVYEVLSAGKNAAFVTLGDPYLFSSYIYLAQHMGKLARQVEIITVPGISAVNAASALGNVPLVAAKERLAVIPLLDKVEDLKPIFALFHTVVIMKIGSALPRLIEFIKNEGLLKDFLLARNMGTFDQFITRDISCLDLNDKTGGYMSVVIVKSKKDEEI